MKLSYSSSMVSRRQVIGALGVAGLCYALPFPRSADAGQKVHTLTAGMGTWRLMGNEEPETPVWAFNGSVPGPVIRIRQGEQAHIRIMNQLEEPTSVHWHGIRLANAMDGVPHLTQRPIPPGGAFDYQFTPPDAGTYWYHSHFRSWEQVARGLHGVLIVDEAQPPVVDQDLLFVVDDWRLEDDGQIAGNFGHMRDASHGGRLGNWLTVNGETKPSVSVQPHGRLRLRCVSTANARIMAFDFSQFSAHVVAVDGQPLEFPTRLDEPLVLAPAQRADLIIDIDAESGTVLQVNEVSTGEPLVAAEFKVSGPKLRETPLGKAMTLPPNPLPELNLDKMDTKVSLLMEGGAMGALREAQIDGKTLDLRTLVLEHGKAWAFNGAMDGHSGEPLFTAKLGQTVAIEITNDTRWQHAMHLHGHHFRVIERNGLTVRDEPWRDTELMQPGDKTTIALVADNPGNWLLHCHMLAHHKAGMGTWFVVTN